jgi:hypothetical protein
MVELHNISGVDPGIFQKNNPIVCCWFFFFFGFVWGGGSGIFGVYCTCL